MGRAWINLVNACVAGSLFILHGCGSTPAPILEATPSSPRWPLLPDAPRLVFLGQLGTSEDLKPSRDLLQRLERAAFGKEPPNAMMTPIAVCTDGGSRVFVADTGARCVHVFDLESRAYAKWEPPEKFSMPVALAFDPSGRVLVADSVRGCLFVFDLGGACTGTMGSGMLKRPCGIAVNREGSVVVVDTGTHQLVVLSSTGKETKRVGSRGSNLGEFNYPTNVAIGSDGSVYVSDSLNFRVQVFSPTLEVVGRIGSQGDLPGYFSQPKGVAVDAQGHVYVVDANFEAVQVFNPDGALLMAMGHEGQGPGEFWLPAGIHIDARGRMYVADSYNQRVQVFQYLTEEIKP